MIYGAFILCFLFLWAFITMIILKLFNKDKPIDKLKQLDEENSAKEKYEKQRKNKDGPLKTLSNLIPSSKLNYKGRKKTEEELMKSDIPVTAQELLVIKALFSFALAFLAYALSKDYIVVCAVFILVWNTPRFIIANRKKGRIKLFDSQLTEGINIISNSLKAGYSFLQAVAVVAEETTDPFSKEFKKLLKEMSLGVSEEEALKNLLNRMESEDLRLIMNAILIQKDIGGNLSEILDNILETIRERQKIKNELKTLTAQGRLSGLIIMLMPVFLGIVIYLFNKEYIMVLFTTAPGIAMIAASFVCEVLGFFMIRKIVSIEM